MRTATVAKLQTRSVFLCQRLLKVGLISVGSYLAISAGIVSGEASAAELSSEAEITEAEITDAEITNAELMYAESNDSTLADQPLANDLSEPAALAQVTSVSELSDVQPSDWAFTALQRLVEEYGCLEGYPDQTFRGDRPLTRYEFAAGLNACLDVVNQLIGPGPEPDSVRRLYEEWAVELAMVRSQVDTLETDVAELEANQFSTTTKLSVQLYTHLDYATAGDGLSAEGRSVFVPARDPITNDPVVRTIDDNPALTFSYLTFFNFTTSFTGKDQLQLQLVAGDGTAPANFYGSAGLFNTFGTPFTLQTGAPRQDSLQVREVFYSFPVGDKLSFTIGPKINWYRHFDNNRFTFFGTGANTFNSSGGTQVNTIDRGAGLVAELDITDWLDFRVGYLGEANEFLPGPRSSTINGLFAGTTTLTGQLGIYPTDNLNLRFLYTRSNIATNAAGFVGGAVSEPIYGFVDDGFGGPLQTVTADTFLFNFDWLLTKGLGLFGRYSYGSTHVFPISDERPSGDVNAQSVQLGVALLDLFKKGAQANISYVQPFDVISGRDFLISGGGDGAVQQEVEVSYRYPISQNFSVIPSIYWINNVNNFGDNPDLYVFNLQTQFNF
ncbi:MAG: iron uptake porin [Phormidesmis sp.]